MIYDLKDLLKRFFHARLGVLLVVFMLMFLTLIWRVFSLQILHGSEYQDDFTEEIHKTISVTGTRGNIYDCNGNLLAYNELAYSVVISDNGSYTAKDGKSATKIKNESLNAELAEILGVLHKNNEEIANTFKISLNSDGEYEYNVTGSSKNRFIADVYGASSYSDLTYSEKLGYDLSKATAEQVMEYLMSSSVYDVSEEYDRQTAYEITLFRYAIAGNAYARYKTTTIADDVSEETIAYINEHSDTLTGASIAESTVRRYNNSVYFASIIGYTGRISEDEYEELSKTDDSYTTNDMVGKSGLEQYYESYLRGTNGEEEVYINNVGKITQVISTTDSTPGNDLYLSIDSDLQITCYKLLEQEIAGIVYSKINSGSITMSEVYFALLDNNVVDITHFSDENASATEQEVYSTFSRLQVSVLENVQKQLTTEPVALNDMSDQMLDYFTCIFSELKSDGILLSGSIDTEDDTYQDWKANKLSPKEYLSYCISKQWVDVSLLNLDNQYADTDEVYRALTSYIMEEIASDDEFSKLIYQGLIENGYVSGRQICMIMLEQGAIDYDDSEYNDLVSGTVSAKSFLMEKIDNLEITPAQLALDTCSGSCVMTDPDTGEIKALVSYPGYDNNRLANNVDSEYYAQLQNDKSKPLYNYATQEKTAPGSTFKMVTATAGLAENLITTTSTIDCKGIFTEVDNQPKCWAYPDSHGRDNVSEALRDSCNVFFYTLGYRLAFMDGNKLYSDRTGISYIQKYASLYGLDRKTGLEISETEPEMASQYPVMAAIGQSDNNYTTVDLSRYVTAVTSGKVYNYQLMSKIVDTEGNVVEEYEPEYEDISSTLNSFQWNAIHQGMLMVCQNMDTFQGCSLSVAGKTGTAQQSESKPNHALFVGYAPYSNPEITIAVRISYGYTSHNAATAARNILEVYFGQKSLDDFLSASSASISGSDAATD